MESDNFEHSEDNILIIKGKFKAAALNIYGQFLLIFNDNERFESYNCVVSTYSDLYDLEPHEEWTKYEEEIANIKWKGNFNANMTASLIDQFKKFSEEMNSVSILYDNAYEYDYNSLDVTLFDLINRIIHDKSLILETGIQEITPADFRESKKNIGKSQDTPQEKQVAHDTYSLEEGSVILTVKSILSPVKGRPIYELRVGDQLMVNIQPNSERSNYFIDLLELREESTIKPTLAEVIDIKAGSGKHDPTVILTMIAPRLYDNFLKKKNRSN